MIVNDDTLPLDFSNSILELSKPHSKKVKIISSLSARLHFAVNRITQPFLDNHYLIVGTLVKNFFEIHILRKKGNKFVLLEEVTLISSFMETLERIFREKYPYRAFFMYAKKRRSDFEKIPKLVHVEGFMIDNGFNEILINGGLIKAITDVDELYSQRYGIHDFCLKYTMKIGRNTFPLTQLGDPISKSETTSIIEYMDKTLEVCFI